MPVTSRKQATLNDVALHSGVSYQTVSRVVNNHPHVAEETRERVLKAIQALDYRPNRAARSLVTRRSSTIGIISFGTTYYGPAQMAVNIERVIKERGYTLTVSTIGEPSSEELHTAVSELKSRAVDGVIMITPIVDIDLAAVSTLFGQLPFVMVDTASSTLPSVTINQAYGAKLATQHLVGLGHRHIVQISGPLNWGDARLRHEGWLHSMRSAGLEPRGLESDWTARGGYRAAQQLLEGAAFSALVAGNDQMALGAMRALREHGLRVPEDVSVVGFDDLPEAAYFEPPLTTVRQDFVSLGRQSVEHLLALFDDAPKPLHPSVLYPELIVRLSTSEWRPTLLNV